MKIWYTSLRITDKAYQTVKFYIFYLTFQPQSSLCCFFLDKDLFLSLKIFAVLITGLTIWVQT